MTELEQLLHADTGGAQHLDDGPRLVRPPRERRVDAPAAVVAVTDRPDRDAGGQTEKEHLAGEPGIDLAILRVHRVVGPAHRKVPDLYFLRFRQPSWTRF